MQSGAVAKKFIHGQLAVDRRDFRQITQSPLGFLGLIKDIDAIDQDLAGCRRKVAADHLHGGGLARAVRPEKTQNFAFLQRETDIVDGAMIAVITGKLINLYERVHKELGRNGRTDLT